MEQKTDLFQQKVKRVSRHQQQWNTLPVSQKLRYLDSIANFAEMNYELCAQLSREVRGLDAENFPHLIGPSYLMGVGTLGMLLNVLTDTYNYLSNNNTPPPPVSTRQRGDQQIAKVFPMKSLDKVSPFSNRVRLLCCHLEIELWSIPNTEMKQNMLESSPGCCCILGAGNYEGYHDILSKMFVEGKVCIYKPNPVNQKASEEVVTKLFADLIKDGYLEVIVGGEQVGQQLINCPEVDEILMTGGVKTFNRIVWGPAEEQQKNKTSGMKHMSKKFDAELGAVSPWIIVPGEWTKAEMLEQATLLVGAKIVNGSAICASPQLVVVDKGWKQRDEFMQTLNEVFDKSLPQPLYYPGMAQRWQRFKDEYGDKAVITGSVFKDIKSKESINLMLIRDADPHSMIAKEEAFAPVLGEVALDTGGDPAAFLKAAVDYCNKDVFGSLSCSLIIDPRTEALYANELEVAVAELQWGAVAVNDWAGITCFYGQSSWGAFPKHSAEDIQSGSGKIMNGLMYSNVQKMVMKSKFSTGGHLKPPEAGAWAVKVGSRTGWYCLRPSTWRLVQVLSAAVLGI